LRARSRPGEYVEKSARADDTGSDWIVTFAAAGLVKDGLCWIYVQKSNCAAIWVPLRRVAVAV